MAQDASDRSVSDLPEGVRDWVASLAAEEGLSEEELLANLVSSGVTDDSVSRADFDERVEQLEGKLDQLSTDVDLLDSDVDEKIADVRERIVQVKREADGKAAEDHTHGDLVNRLNDLDDDIDAVFVEIDEVEERFEAEIENVTEDVEGITEDLNERAADLSKKLTVLAVTVVEMRDQIRTVLAERQQRTLVEELKTEANRHGARSAKCEECSNSVQIGLLSAPRCPHCNESFEELDPKEGFFGSNVLATGQPPALQGEVDVEDSKLEDMIED